MKSLVVFIAVLILLPFSLFAQKTRPMMDDVITLHDILRKDYNAIEPLSSRLAALEKDRTTVMSILRNYVKPVYYCSK